MSGVADAPLPPTVAAVLRAAELATAETAAASRLQDLSRSHTVTMAELPDGSAYVVKRLSAQARDDGRSLAAELFAYRLASGRPGLAAVMPEPVHLDERNQVLALVAAPPRQLFPALYLEPGFPPASLAAALGRALAILHRETEGLPLPTTAACGTVHLADVERPDELLLGDSPSASAVVETVVADPDLATSLRGTAASLKPSCLVHADVKWDNTVLRPGPPAEVLLFDWELSGHGDPAWDVGSALADIVVLRLRVHGAAALATDPTAWLDSVPRALLSAYGGNSADLAARICGCWVARTVHLAIECATAVGSAEEPAVLDLLGLARRLADHQEPLTSAIDDALAAAG